MEQPCATFATPGQRRRHLLRQCLRNPRIQASKDFYTPQTECHNETSIRDDSDLPSVRRSRPGPNQPRRDGTIYGIKHDQPPQSEHGACAERGTGAGCQPRQFAGPHQSQQSTRPDSARRQQSAGFKTVRTGLSWIELALAWVRSERACLAVRRAAERQGLSTGHSSARVNLFDRRSSRRSPIE